MEFVLLNVVLNKGNQITKLQKKFTLKVILNILSNQPVEISSGKV